MKRVKLKDRVRLLAETRAQLFAAATNANNPNSTPYWRRDAEKNLELAALEFGKVSIRYLGGKWE